MNFDPGDLGWAGGCVGGGDAPRGTERLRRDHLDQPAPVEQRRNPAGGAVEVPRRDRDKGPLGRALRQRRPERRPQAGHAPPGAGGGQEPLRRRGGVRVVTLGGVAEEGRDGRRTRRRGGGEGVRRRPRPRPARTERRGGGERPDRRGRRERRRRRGDVAEDEERGRGRAGALGAQGSVQLGRPGAVGVHVDLPQARRTLAG